MPFETIQMAFASGLDENTDPVHTVKLRYASNVRFDKIGRLTKRYGVSALATSVVNPKGVVPQPTTLTSASKALSYNDELLAIDGTCRALYSYSRNASAWLTKDETSEATVSRTTVAQGIQSAIGVDTAIIGNVQVFVWQTAEATASNNLFQTGPIYSTAVDLTTGATIYENVPISGAFRRVAPRVVTGTILGVPTFMCIYADMTGRMLFATLNATSPQSGWSNETVLLTDMANYGGSPTQFAGAFDAATDGANSLWVVYEGTGTVPNNVNLKLYTFGTTTLVRTAHPGDATTTPVFAVGLLYDAGTSAVYPAWSSNDGTHATIKVAKYDTTGLMSQIVGATVVYTYTYTQNAIPYTIGMATSGTVLAVVNGPAAVRFEAVYASTVDLSVPDVPIEQYGVQPCSRPFVVGGHFYVWAVSAPVFPTVASIQSAMFLLDMNHGITAADGVSNPCRPVAVAAVRQAARGTAGSCLTHVMSPGANLYSVPGLISNRGQSEVTNYVARFFDTQMGMQCDAQSSIEITGGVPQLYDGSGVVENGFLWYPQLDTTQTAITSTGGQLAQGVYQWTVCYEWTDARGQWHRSAPSPPITFTTANTTSYLSLAVPILALTNRWKNTTGVSRHQNVYAVVYRTVAGGTTFYRSTAINIPLGNLVGPNTAGLASAYGTITITDAKSGDGSAAADTDLQNNAVLYTTGGVLPGFCPPSSRFCVQHKNRVWLAGTDDGRTLWYSKQLTESIAPEFNDAQTIIIDRGGDVTGLASIDDKLIVFKSDSVWVIYGDGPNDLGNGADYVVQQLASDVGCIDARSIVAGADGVFFQSRRGIEILTRGLDVQWIGRDIQEEVALYSNVTSGTVVASQRQVRFTASIPGIANGETFVYDTAARGWTTYSHNGGDAAASATMWNGVWSYVRVDGAAFYEDTTTYQDSGANWVTASVITDWKKWSQVEGWARTRRVGALIEMATPADLNVSVYLDFAQSPIVTRTFDDHAPASGIPDVLKVDPPVQKGQAISVLLQDSTPTFGSIGTGQGMTFHGLAFEAMIKRGIVRTPQSKRG